MNYIVLDLEWNQCPQGKEYEVAALPFEIFEIGAVKLDSERNIIDRFSCYIRPQVYKELHFMAKILTHTSMEVLNGGMPFGEAAADFFEWCGERGSYYMCTWGQTDLIELQRNMEYFGVENPFSFPLFYYDVQKLFSLDKEDGKIRRALEAAVDMLGAPKKEAFHNAAGDAEYTAMIMQAVDMDVVGRFLSIDTYRIPTAPKNEIDVSYGTYAKYITMGYDNREDLLKNPRLINTKCYICKKTARKKIRWFSSNSKAHYCLAECKEHGYIKCRFRVREALDGKYFAIRIMKITDEKGAKDVRKRQQDISRRRSEKRRQRVERLKGIDKS